MSDTYGVLKYRWVYLVFTLSADIISIITLVSVYSSMEKGQSATLACIVANCPPVVMHSKLASLLLL